MAIGTRIMKVYSIKETYLTLQGEGAQTGRAAVFLRFTGCNLWNGLETGRASAVCDFCDTDFVGMDGPGGGQWDDPAALATHARAVWDAAGLANGVPYIVCTGGEPFLQLDTPLIGKLHEEGFEIGVETNGTLPAPLGIDWLCVSPKADAQLAQNCGDELKLVYPQEKAQPEQFEALDFTYFFLQPLDSPEQAHNIALAADYCMKHPKWRLSLQTHKLIGLP